MKIQAKRVYEDLEQGEFRVLVDRLWPRGLSKQKAKLDCWAKSIAPSNELRKWYHQHPKQWASFKTKYIVELEANQSEVEDFLNILQSAISGDQDVVFLSAARELELSHVVVLKDYLGHLK